MTEDSKWKCTLRFLKKKKYTPLVFGKNLELSWKIHSLSGLKLPFNFFSCQMKCGEVITRGTGESVFPKLGMKKAFSESWERLWLLHPSLQSEATLDVNSSNGFAAGATAPEALRRAKDELIERALLLKAWTEMKGWSRYFCSARSLGFLLAELKSAGWSFDYFEIQSSMGHRTLFLLARHSEHGAVVDTQLRNPQSPKLTEVKLTLSVMRSIQFLDFVPVVDFSGLPEKGVPIDHAAFYRNVEHLKAFDFLDSVSKPANVIDLKYTNSVSSLILYSGGEMPAIALATNQNWECLLWGKNSIRGTNPYPHPLA
jgi:hypothetical protein